MEKKKYLCLREKFISMHTWWYNSVTKQRERRSRTIELEIRNFYATQSNVMILDSLYLLILN